jgi:flagellar protein FlbD
MITLTRLSGSKFVLNSDLIERIDSTPDSVVTLIDGKKYVVSESLEEIIDAVRAYRSEVVAFGAHLADGVHGSQDLAAAARAARPTPAATERPTLVPVADAHQER